MSDLRPYFAKIYNGNAVALPRNIPEKNFMENVDIRMLPIEKWTNVTNTTNTRTLKMKMVCYSKDKINELMMNGLNCSRLGPDLYELYEGAYVEPSMVVRLSPLSCNIVVTTYLYNKHEDGHFTKDVQATTIELTSDTTNEQINTKLNEIWAKVTNEQWIRSPISNAPVDFIITF
jgi:hypothetical protein